MKWSRLSAAPRELEASRLETATKQSPLAPAVLVIVGTPGRPEALNPRFSNCLVHVRRRSSLQCVYTTARTSASTSCSKYSFARSDQEVTLAKYKDIRSLVRPLAGLTGMHFGSLSYTAPSSLPPAVGTCPS